MKRATLVVSLLIAFAQSPALAQKLTPDYGTQRYDCGEADRAWCRLKPEVDVADLERRLGGKSFVYWTDGKVLNVAARAAEQLTFCCTIQPPLTRVGATDIWVVSIRMPRLDEAVIGLGVYGKDFAYRSYGDYRGPGAPLPPKFADPLQGTLRTVAIESRFADSPRELLIYDPPARAGRPRAVVYVADGTIESYAPVVEPLILDRRIPPVRLVGLKAWEGAQANHETRSAHRNGEYVLGVNPALKARHDAYFLNEVIPRSEADLRKRGLKRFTAGQSGGGAWALTTALENRSLISGSISMSPAITPKAYPSLKPGKHQRYFFVGGLLEGRNAAMNYDHLAAMGADACLTTPVDGHSMTMYQAFLPEALEAALTKGPCPRLER